MAQDLNRSIKIFIDNTDAMEKYNKLTASTEKLKSRLEELRAAGKQESDQFAKTQRDLERDLKQRGAHINKIKETERVLKNLSGATYGELEAVRKQLRSNLKKTERGTVEYTEKLKIYHNVQKQISVANKEMNGQLGAQGTLMSKAANGFNKYFGMLTTGLATITGISFAFRKLSRDAAEMDDVYSDVMKTTGMTHDEVLDMNETLKDIDTRTSREQLNMLARDAGKLGLTARKDILDFVEAADQIQVALGEDLGDGAIREVGKMADVFTRSTREFEGLGLKEKMLAVGSAINEIGASSTANEQYLVQFTGRLGGVATQAGIGIDKIMGYASALDQDMQQVEMSATALQQLIMKVMGDPAKFAEIAGMEVSAFTDLLKNDANEAIITVLRSLNEKGGFQDLIPIFEGMKLNGTRAVGVLSSLAGSIDKVEAAQELANKSMVEATSLTDEFNIKNNNAAAELEKRKKSFKDAAEELGRRLNPALLKSTNIVTYLVKLLPGFLDFLGKYGKYILYLATVYAAYTGAVKLNTFWQKSLKDTLSMTNIQLKLQNTLYIAGRISGAAYNVVVGLLTGNLSKARTAWKLLNASMSTTPVGLLVAGITALAGAFILLRNNTARARTEKQALDKISKDVAKSTAAERAELDQLLGVARNEEISKEARLKAIKRLNEISPEYLSNLSLENINTDAARKSVEKYTLALQENAKQKAIGDKMSELYAKLYEQEAKRAEHESILEGRRASGLAQSDIDRSHQNSIDNINRRISAINKEIEVYNQLSQTVVKNQEVDEGLAKWRENTNKMGKVQLESWIKNNKDAADEYLEIANEVFKARFIDVPDPTAGGGEEDKNKYKKKLAELEKYINEEKNKLSQARIDGVMTEYEYGRQLELLETDRLARMLEIYEIDSEKRVEVENLMLNHKLKMLKTIEDEELLHQKKSLELQNKETENKKKADEERAKNNLKALKQIAKQNEENYKKEFERENKRKANLVAIGMDFSSEMGELLGGALSGNEDLVASSLKNIINMGLDLLKVQVQMAVAGATAQSLAQPDSVATFGASGLARAAILVGLIEAAFAAVKTVIGGVVGKLGGNTSSTGVASDSVTGSRVVTQRASGKYDVIGAEDGRLYQGVPYAGPAQTGFVSTPTLMGEQGRELVVSAPDLSRLQRHINYPLIIRAINDARAGVVPQRAAGNYNSVSSQEPVQTLSFDPAIMAEVRDLLLFLKSNPLKAYVLLSELQSQQELSLKSKKIGSK